LGSRRDGNHPHLEKSPPQAPPSKTKKERGYLKKTDFLSNSARKNRPDGTLKASPKGGDRFVDAHRRGESSRGLMRGKGGPGLRGLLNNKQRGKTTSRTTGRESSYQTRGGKNTFTSQGSSNLSGGKLRRPKERSGAKAQEGRFKKAFCLSWGEDCAHAENASHVLKKKKNKKTAWV